MDVILVAPMIAVLAAIAGLGWWHGRAIEAPEPAIALDRVATHFRLDARDIERNRLAFERDGFSIDLRIEAHNKFRIRVDGPDRLPAWLHIVPQREGQPELPNAIETQDTFIDSAFCVAGRPRPTAALLRQSVRADLLALRSVRVQNGTIESRCATSRLTHLERWLDRVLNLAHQLADVPEALDAALFSVLDEDPNPYVRLNALLLLVEPITDSAMRANALQRGLADPDPWVRCTAAVQSEDGLAELRGLAGGYDLPEDIRLRAFNELFKRQPGAALVDLLIPAAAGPVGRLSRRALGWAFAYGGIDALKAIIQTPRIPIQGFRSALELARRHMVRDVAPTLVNVLGWDWASDERRLAAIRGLGILGGPDAIPALKQIQQYDPTLGGFAREAVLAIQSRDQKRLAGALSVVGEDGGQLAVVEAGTLGLADDEET